MVCPSFDTAFLLAQQLYTGFFLSFVARVLPLVVQQLYTGFVLSFLARVIPLVVETFGYSDFVLKISFIGASIAMTVMALVVGRLNLSSRGVYSCGILSLLSSFSATFCCTLYH